MENGIISLQFVFMTAIDIDVKAMA